MFFPFCFHSRNPPNSVIHSLHRLITGDCIELIVGEQKQQQRLCVHKDLVCSKSIYFQKALGEGFKEGVEQQIRFPDDKPGTVAAFVAWVYSGNLDHLGEQYANTLRLYQFADRLCLVALQDKCLDHLRCIMAATDVVPDWQLVVRHFETSVPSDPMRKLLVDMWTTVWTSNNVTIREYLEGQELKHDLVTDLFCRLHEIILQRETNRTAKPLRRTSFYHIA